MVASLLSQVARQQDLEILKSEAQRCMRCDLSNSRTSVVFGSGDSSARLVLLGEGPGALEDETGEPFVGRSGQLLMKLLADEIGLKRHEVYITSMVKCRPPGNRNPSKREVAECQPYLIEQLRLIDPVVVVTLGNVATQTMLETKDGITVLHGKAFSSPLCGALVMPTFHPAAALRGRPAVEAALREDLRHVRAVLEAE